MRSNSRRRFAIRRAVLEALEGRRLLSLAAPISYPVGSPPQALATGDFNGDGRGDVVTANANGTVAVRLSNADGTLQSAQSSPTGTNPRSIAVGDINNDGKLDVVTANGGGNLSVLIGNGNGTFQAPLNIVLPPQLPTGYTGTTPLAQAPISVVVGDMNADGKLDLVATGWTTFLEPYTGYYGGTYYRERLDEHVNVLLGNGAGGFSTASTYQQPFLSSSVGVGDFNNDGKLDVVTAPGAARVMLGNGNGTLQPAVQSAAFGYAQEQVIGDFDNDGKLDLVLRSGSGLQLMKGQGNGTFTAAPTGILPGGNIRAVVAGDVDNDGKLDLVVTAQQTTYDYYGYYNYGPHTTDSRKVLLGFGDGTISLPIASTLRTFDGYPTYGGAALALADLNGDGRRDVVATELDAALIEVQLNQGAWFPPVAMQIGDASVTEGHAGTVNAVFTVTLDHAVDFNVSVDYDTADGTATAAANDFVATSGTLSFAPGQTSKTITVQVKGDRVGEPNEQFYVDLTNPTNAALIDARGAGTIVDDEPRLSITNSPTVVEGNSGTKPMNFTATLSAASDQPVTVKYSTGPWGSATAGVDFDAVSGTLTFQPGQTSQTIAVPIRGDVQAEYDESVYVSLADATNALITNPLGQGAIDDDDAGPAIRISNVSRAEGNSGTTPFQFTISLESPSGRAATVSYATANGSASSTGGNRDYQSTSGSVTFFPGQTTQTVTVSVFGDTRNESDETFVVNLSNAGDATIADAQGVGTILNDESRGKTWVGPASGGSWSTASNWSPSGVPVATSLVTIGGASVTLPASASVSEVSLRNGATLTLAPNGGRVLRTAGLFLDGGDATLNLNDNDLIVDYTAGSSPLGAWNVSYFDGLLGELATGRNGGTWDGAGLVTTRPDALSGLTTLAAVEAADVLNFSGAPTATFAGQTVDATTILVKYTYGGDANLDGAITGDDYSSIDFGILIPGMSGWSNGDFNHDGYVTGDDYSVIDLNILLQGAPL